MADPSCGNHEEEWSRNGTDEVTNHERGAIAGEFFSGLQTLEVKDVLDSRETKVRKFDIQ